MNSKTTSNLLIRSIRTIKKLKVILALLALLTIPLLTTLTIKYNTVSKSAISTQATVDSLQVTIQSIFNELSRQNYVDTWHGRVMSSTSPEIFKAKLEELQAEINATSTSD